MSRNYDRNDLFCSTRLSVIIIAFFTVTSCYMIRVDVNVTLLSMVNFTSTFNESRVSTNYLCATTDITKPSNFEVVHSTGSYFWDSKTQGYILGAFYWGYIFTQIPGKISGILLLRYGPKWLGAFCIGGSAILDLLLPTAAELGPKVLTALRVFQGLCQGVLMPMIGCIVGRWIPPNERSRATAFSLAGYVLA
ncbi:hypothetical protein FGIG_02455 [Fasciola gigantica]|uniref:Major facilitator superfamily (MFS) profile domain-containing protein n=1 Tax=Fasciola gigantica TaxID=46835 RepID=A0A504YF13_FASGI|nr:hypothetical protein FGIG_02455 [Fasciola gigantica]